MNDRLNSVPLSEAAQSTFAVLDRLQTMPRPETRVVAAACAVFLMARRYGINPNDLWNTANNLIHSVDGRQIPEFAGAARYLREEM